MGVYSLCCKLWLRFLAEPLDWIYKQEMHTFFYLYKFRQHLKEFSNLMKKVLLSTLGCLLVASVYSQNRYTTITPTQFKPKSNQDIYIEARANTISSKNSYESNNSNLLEGSYFDIYSSSSYNTNVADSIIHQNNYITLVYNRHNKLVGLAINEKDNLYETIESYNLYESSHYVILGNENVKVYECKLKYEDFEGDNVFYFSVKADFSECVIYYGAHLMKVFYIDKFELRTTK